MVLTNSRMLDLGTKAPEFNLPNVVNGDTLALHNIKGEKGTLIAFICNHCPYVVHIIDPLTEHLNRYQKLGIGIACISANDVVSHPDDHPDKMAALAKQKGFEFPYLYDESQDTAKAFGAECTPDFFLYNAEQTLVYRGQFDDSRPGNSIAVTGNDLNNAVDALVSGAPAPSQQYPSIGCNIKWKL